jgi:small GTP-binding protein
MAGASDRVVTIGNSSVGKTFIISTYMGDRFNAGEVATIGANWWVATRRLGERSVTMHIWDTAGQECCRALGPLYSRDARAATVVFDIISLETWQAVPAWVNAFNSVVGNDVALFIVGNKVDRAKARQVSESDASTWAEQNGYEYIETSALTGQGVNELFEKIVQSIAHLRRETVGHPEPKGSGCC